MSPKRIPYQMEKLNIMIRECIEEAMNEIYDNPIQTKYQVLTNFNYNGYAVDTYRFKTNAGNSYDMDFIDGAILPHKIVLINNKEKILSDILNKNTYQLMLEYVELGFTPSEIKDIDVDQDIIGTMDDPFIGRTNRNEQFELLNRVSFLVQEFIKNNPNIYIYSIGKNTTKNNLSTYIYIFNKIFGNNYKMFDVESPNFKLGSFYFINKKILK